MHIDWFWFALGLFPYSIKQQHERKMQLLRVYAFFWQLTIEWHGKRCSWKLYIPLLEQLRQ
jgi:hypothetical protein